MTTPRSYARVLMALYFLWIGLAAFDRWIMGWSFFDSPALTPWLASCFAASYVCQALHLVWEKL